MLTKGIKTTSLVLLLSLGVSLPTQAAMIPTADAVQMALPTVADQRAAVSAFLARSDVQAELVRYGVEPAAAADRVAALSDDEVATLYQRVDQATAGGDGVIGALVFVFIVLLVTDILGLTKIFPFTRPINR